MMAARNLTDRDPGDETRNLQTLRPDLDIVLWRHEQLVRAGYSVLGAMAVAERTDVDLHQAINLVAAGATPGEAMRILL